MSYKIVISESANKDLNSIFEYLSVRLHNKKAAANFAKEVHDKYMLLSEHPLMFQLSNDIRLKKRGYRKIAIDNYVIVYRVVPNENEVFVARIFYGKRDFEQNI